MIKKMLAVVFCACVVVACGNGQDAMKQKMEETAKMNQAFKEAEEAKKKEKPKFVDDQVKEELPAIVDAAAKVNLSAVKSEFGKGTLVDTKDERSRTPLYMAASEGKKDVVDYLIEEGANVNTKRDDGDNPLMAAARKGNLEIVTALVEHGADVSQADNFGRTPLMMAAQSGSKETVDFILGKGADINATDKYDLSALIFAMKANKMDLAKYILSKGAKVWKPKPLKIDEKPLVLKIEGKVQPGMEEVIENLDKKDVTLHQKTELFYAVEKGDLDLVKLLVQKGSPVLIDDVEQSRETIIYVFGQKEEERDMLFQRKVTRTSYDRDQKNLLHYAAEGGYVEIMKFLISKGARLEETDGENVRGPLFYVVAQEVDPKDPGKEKRLVETADYIIEEGKKTWTKRVRLSKKELDKLREAEKHKNWWERNPFDTEWKDITAPKVDIEEYDYEGWHVLALAAKYGHTDIVKLLIQKGANINHKERKMGNTALIYSRVGKFKEMEQFLLANCAKEGINFDHEELAKQGWKCVDGKEVFEKPAE